MLPWVLLLPVVIVAAAGVYYVYNEFLLFVSDGCVRNKVVVITDAVSGVGSELAALFHRGGARLVLCGSSWDKLDSLYDVLSTKADPRETFSPKLVLVDFSEPDGIEEVVSEVLDCYGYVDVLICNSSIKVRGAVQSISLEVDRNVMDINYFGPATLAKGVLPSMMSRRGGQIVLVSSVHGRLAVPFRSSYAASKHAAQAFFDCLRAEVEEYGITVSTVSHTFINSTAAAPEPTPTEPTPTPPEPTPTPPEPTLAPTEPTPPEASPAPPEPTPPAAAPEADPPAAAPETVSKAAAVLGLITTYVWKQLVHGVRPSALAHEVLLTVKRRKREVLLSHPLPRAALYLRSLLPPLLFSVLSAGVRDHSLAEHIQ